jgi:lysophospholipase L1-like esterase
MLRLTTLTRVVATSALVALAACSDNTKLLGPSTPVGGDIFKSYVALGNSITAGFQSNGIMDSTQRQSYARLLAIQMGTQYHYAALAGRGCTPPIVNGLTGALFANAPAGTCDLRTTTSVTDILNNVAVPGARVLDPTSSSTVASNALTTFILGGKTQVQKALDANPTFVSIWIGNNDVLQPALSGLFQPIVSTQAQFQTSYDLMIQQLLAGAPNLKGILIGVAMVQYLPSVSSGALVFASPQAQGAINAATGMTVVIDASCNGSTSLLNIPQLILAIRAGTHPAVIACAKGIFPAPVGDIFVLDPAEQVTLTAAITAYNAYINTKAAAIGFAYYDPNVLFAASRASGAIPPFPNFASTTATYGLLITLDGVHPSAATHKLIANELIGVINAKYATSLKPVP